MSLPNEHTDIQQASIYPDRIQVNYQYTFPHGSLQAIYTDGFSQLSGFRLNRSSRRIVGQIECDSLGTTFKISISRPVPAAPISVYVDVNPLTY